jgi:hypothetical protein
MDHCDPRWTQPSRKGEHECYPPITVRLAALVTRQRLYDIRGRAMLILTIDRGSDASVSKDYFVSILDADDRPMTKWAHPTEVSSEESRFEVPGMNIEPGKTRVAVVKDLFPEDRFPDTDPRGAQ